MLSFHEWLEHWGEDRLAEKIKFCQAINLEHWNNTDSMGQFPAWELVEGHYWEESLEEWRARWKSCGGTLYEGRMIASKRDPVWRELSGTFYDGLGFAYPPFTRSSCMLWRQISWNECKNLGVAIDEFTRAAADRMQAEGLAELKASGLTVEDLRAARTEITVSIESSRQKIQRDDVFIQVENERQQRSNELEAKNSVFRLLEQVEMTLREQPEIKDPRRWGWLCESLKALTTTHYFDEYPNWRARAWLAFANMYLTKHDSSSELLCLQRALQLDERLPIKRRIKALCK